MAQKKQGKQSIVQRLRARIKKQQTQLKTKSMAYGRRRSNFRRPKFRNPFRRRQSFRQQPRRNNYKQSGGFNRRLPLLGFKVPNILIWLAIIGGGAFFGKDYIKPLIDKLKHRA